MFKPTYLYIKRHSITGKCYFGKTTSSDPVKYTGSGKAWIGHLKKYGYDQVETLWCKLFTDQVECSLVALTFSRQQDIVDSKLWLNMIPENGLDGPGRVKGFKMSQKSRDLISKSRSGKKMSDEQKANLSSYWKGRRVVTAEHKAAISAAHKGKIVSSETKAKISDSQKNRDEEWRRRQQFAQKRLVVCPHCLKEGTVAIMKRWHFDNCKQQGSD